MRVAHVDRTNRKTKGLDLIGLEIESAPQGLLAIVAHIAGRLELASPGHGVVAPSHPRFCDTLVGILKSMRLASPLKLINRWLDASGHVEEEYVIKRF
jgi:hypothetical protein